MEDLAGFLKGEKQPYMIQLIVCVSVTHLLFQSVSHGHVRPDTSTTHKKEYHMFITSFGPPEMGYYRFNTGQSQYKATPSILGSPDFPPEIFSRKTYKEVPLYNNYNILSSTKLSSLVSLLCGVTLLISGCLVSDSRIAWL